MADFGLSRRLEDGSTVYTVRAGTRCWEAVETLDQTERTGYKTSSDVQVAGMLVYYLLSVGKHPFEGNNLWEQEAKIREGNYSLDEVDDVVAKDLIERMISKVPEERPTVDEALNHPYFWDDVRKDAVLRKLGDIREVQYYLDLETLHILYHEVKNSDGEEPTVDQIIDRLITSKPKSTPKRKLLDLRKTLTEIVGDNFAKVVNLCDTVKKYNESFSTWKTKLPGNEEIPFPDDLLGLLRFMRNKLVHEKDKFDEINRLNHFPDFFISLQRLAKDLNWDY
ncbi:uncharacterized protein [Paramisgurnus dabryanus]|uniref:uncharacterized protein n=1 Tax=Paramisgurnus dabryanus TaxID=90735 RepID=UPI003CCF6723